MRALLASSSLLVAFAIPCAIVADMPSARPAEEERAIAEGIPTIDLAMQEWGVWQLDARGRVRSLEEVARESPTFVHRQVGVPDAASQLPSVRPEAQVFEKPVIFFFAYRPIDITVTVRVPNGRPWLYYPSATLGRDHGDAAIRFQGTLLSQQAPLPAGAQLPTPPSGHWWHHLRGVNASAFVTADGHEAERFLFYDGQAPFERGFMYRRRTLTPTSSNVDALAWSIDGDAATRLVIQTGHVSRTRMVSKAAVEDELRTRLRMRGLSAPIADALIATWRTELFASRERRVIWLLSEAAYDAMLPIEVVPAPQYRRRVGVVIEAY